MTTAEKNRISSFFDNIRISIPQTYKNLTVIPFSHTNGNKVEFISLPKAIKTDRFIIKEMDEGARVSNIKVINDTDYNVLIIDGEQFVGAKQNRIINTTVFVRKRSKIVLDVSCVEEGRWNEISDKFDVSENMLHFTSRLKKMQEVNQNLKVNNRFAANQSEVWDDVHSLMSEHNVYSKTSSMNDVYQRRNNELNIFIEEFELLEEQNGIFVFLNNNIAGVEYISSAEVFEEYFPKIVKSYAIKAISKKSIHIDEDFDYIQSAKEFVQSLKDCEIDTYSSLGAGTDHRFKNSKIIGSALEVDNEIVHLVGFNVNEKRPRRKGNWMRLDDDIQF